MIYPPVIMELFEEFHKKDLQLTKLEEKGTDVSVDEHLQVCDLVDELASLSDSIYSEAEIYAAESGADRDGGYDPDRLFDELMEQAGV